MIQVDGISDLIVILIKRANKNAWVSDWAILT
jgi:hypothetical protein